MSYNPTTWKSGDKVTSNKLNKIETGIVNASESIDTVSQDVQYLTSLVSVNKTYPAFEVGGINTTTGQTESATAWLRSYDYLKNISAIESNGVYVVRIFNYSEDKTFQNYEQFNLDGYLDLSTKITGKYIKIAMHHTDWSNIKLSDENGKIALYDYGNGTIFNPNNLTHYNWSSSSGNFQSNTYQYRNSWRVFFPITDFGGIVSKYGFQYMIGLYDNSFTYLGNIAWKESELFTQDLLNDYCEVKGYSATYMTILIGQRSTSYALSDSDFETNWYIYPNGEDASDIIDSILLSDGYLYGGERIVLEQNRMNYLAGWLNTEYGYGQDADCYGNYVVRFTSRGEVLIYDVVNKARLGDVVTLTGIIPHANSVCFGNEKYNENDYFPLIYANAYNNTGLPRGTLYAYRVQLSDQNVLTVTLVQTITIDFTADSLWTTGSDNRPYGNFAVDHDRNRLIAYTTLDGDVNKTRIFEFGMPSLTDGEIVTLSKTDIYTWYDVDKQAFPQGVCYYNGKLYCISGFGDADPSGNQGYLQVIDLYLKRTVTVINFNDVGIKTEPECIYVHKGRLCGGYGKSYLFNF